MSAYVCPTKQIAYINVVGDLDISVGNGLQESRLWVSACYRSGAVYVPFRNHSLPKDRICTFSRDSNLEQWNSPLTVIEGNLGTFNQKSTVERENVLVNLDISTLGVGNENTVLTISIVPGSNSDSDANPSLSHPRVK
jgi:hypothetical protein